MTSRWLREDLATCCVCATAIRGQYLRSSVGDTWCTSHEALPNCLWCGAPTDDSLEQVPSCSTCSASAQVRTNYRPAVNRVKNWVAETVGPLPTPVRLRVATSASLTAQGHQVSFPAHLGETRWVVSSRGLETATVAIVAGLPLAVFERTLAHEMGHALLAKDLDSSIPLTLVEGLAEVLSYAYLASCVDERLVRELRQSIETNPDPCYGGGFRQVRTSIKQLGLTQAFDVVRTGAWRGLFS